MVWDSFLFLRVKVLVVQNATKRGERGEEKGIPLRRDVRREDRDVPNRQCKNSNKSHCDAADKCDTRVHCAGAPVRAKERFVFFEEHKAYTIIIFI